MTRTLGDTRDCEGCRYWSEMLAQAGAGTENPRGDVEAMCLVAGGPHSHRYTVATDTCDHWAAGNFGAVDDRNNIGADPYAGQPSEKTQRCPTCGELVYSIFDHIDIDCEAT